jgi:CheY-like chemotaxis protein
MLDPSEIANGGELAAVKVLIIEDNRDGADSLRDALALFGHRVAVAYDGAEGLSIAQSFAPDVVICDIGLPDFDGYHVARTLRTQRALCRATLVALTGYGLPEDRMTAKEAGFDAHMTKPADLEQLQSLLSRVQLAR